MLNYDLVARATTQIEGHAHGPLYYLNVLQKDHYEWIALTLLLSLALWLSRHERRSRPSAGENRDLWVVIGIWAAVTALVPTLMATKLAWYLDPFYPVFAVAVASVIAAGFAAFSLPANGRERVLLAIMVLLTFGVAEGKLAWYSYHQRALAGSLQALLVDSRRLLEGRRVAKAEWDPADYFVLKYMAGGVPITGVPQQLGDDPGEQEFIIPAVDERGWRVIDAHGTVSPIR
jgi:hypothetical protein